MTHVFSPSLTNETIVTYSFIGFPNVFADPSKVDRGTVGYGYAGLFKNGVAQIPSFGQFGPSEAALMFNPGGFEAGGKKYSLEDKGLVTVGPPQEFTAQNIDNFSF